MTKIQSAEQTLKFINVRMKKNLTEAQILKNVRDNKPGIVIFANAATMGYFKIEFCPMCGRKLVEE